MSAPTVETPASGTQNVLPSDAVLVDKAEARAIALLEASLGDTSRAEAASSKRLARLLADDAGRDLLLDLTDQVLRIRDRKRAAERLHDLTAGGVPASLGGFDRLGLATLGKVAPAMPWVSEQAVDWRIGKDIEVRANRRDLHRDVVDVWTSNAVEHLVAARAGFIVAEDRFAQQVQVDPEAFTGAALHVLTEGWFFRSEDDVCRVLPDAPIDSLLANPRHRRRDLAEGCQAQPVKPTERCGHTAGS